MGERSLRRTAAFVEMAILRGVPPKVIHLTLGNVPTGVVRAYLLANADAIRFFLAGSDSVLELGALT
jgi:predicted nuclease of predicted toxin-antitoxin system